MRMYKYYGYEAGLAALKSQRLGFRSPKYFNDPLELSFPIEDPSPNGEQLKRALDVLRKWVVILSLTETPMDPLMWAYYGEGHRGFVIGYNTSEPFLSSPEYNLITAGEGAVNYGTSSSTEIAAAYDSSTIRALLNFGLGARPSDGELDNVRRLAKQVFMTKHQRWCTEKEVRVVKLSNSAFEEASTYQADPLRSVVPYSRIVAPNMSCIVVPGLLLYEHQVKIEEVYLGARNPLAGEERGTEVRSDATLAELAEELGWVIRGVCTSTSSWDLRTVDLASDALEIVQRERGLTHYSTFGAKTARALTKLATCGIDDRDQFVVSTWNGASYLKKNGEFI